MNTVTLELTGTRRKLRMDFNALSLFEEATGRNLLDDGLADFDARATRALVWACAVAYEHVRTSLSLEWCAEQLPLEQIGAELAYDDYPRIDGVLGKLWGLSWPAAADKEGRSVDPLKPLRWLWRTCWRSLSSTWGWRQGMRAD